MENTEKSSDAKTYPDAVSCFSFFVHPSIVVNAMIDLYHHP